MTLVISSVGFPLWLCPASVSPSDQCLPALAALFSSACNESSILCFEDSYYHCLLNVGTYVEVRKQQFLIILLHLPQDALLRNVSSFQDGPIQMSCFILLRQCSFLQRDGAPRNKSILEMEVSSGWKSSFSVADRWVHTTMLPVGSCSATIPFHGLLSFSDCFKPP